MLIEEKCRSQIEERESAISGRDVAVLMQEVFAKKANFRFRARGFSMSPFVRDNDVITLAPTSVVPIAAGKVAACIIPSSKRLVVHRIIDVKDGRCMIKGDNASAMDGIIGKEHILGIAVRVERGNGNVRLGLGPERIIIAFLNKYRLLRLFFCFFRIYPKPLRQFIKFRIIS